ncbi:MAG: Kazal-type serine protease inhibitor [Candidatus Gracilibacteria bacterium]|nr:Kazal-type serine protease inhibitor [Candidatus Gracilibacteria bacterium]
MTIKNILKNKIFLLILAGIFGVLNINNTNASLCTNNYYPVCGKDGITYQNSCYMKEAGVETDYFGSCSGEDKPSGDLTEKSDISEDEARITIFLDNYFVTYKFDYERKIKFINNLLSQIKEVKPDARITEEKIKNVTNAFIKYRDNLISKKEAEEKEKAELEKRKQELIKKEQELIKKLEEENKNTTVIVAEDDEEKTSNNTEKNSDSSEENKDENQDESNNKYITENTKEKVDLLRINYIKDNIGVRALGGARITAFNIVGKTENKDTGITDNYVIVVSEEYYEDKEGGIHTGVQTIIPILMQTKITDDKYEIIGYKKPDGGNNFKDEDLGFIFPADFAKKLSKNNKFFQEKVKELQEINLKNAKIYFENN